jgi:uncharacterized DUF497 family protein
MFVWDEAKRLKVLKNHKVDFELITDIFDDPLGIYRDDFGHSENEIRYTIVGLTAHYGLIFLVFTYTSEKIRFVTARRAENWMVKEYERGI